MFSMQTAVYWLKLKVYTPLHRGREIVYP